MKSALADTSDQYEKIDENVFQMKPIGAKPRRRILTPFGRGVIVSTVVFILVAALYFFLK